MTKLKTILGAGTAIIALAVLAAPAHAARSTVKGWQTFDAGPIIRANFTLCAAKAVRIRFRWTLMDPSYYSVTYTGSDSQAAGCHRHYFTIRDSLDEGWYWSDAEIVLNGRASVFSRRSVRSYVV